MSGPADYWLMRRELRNLLRTLLARLHEQVKDQSLAPHTAMRYLERIRWHLEWVVTTPHTRGRKGSAEASGIEEGESSEDVGDLLTKLQGEREA